MGEGGEEVISGSLLSAALKRTGVVPSLVVQMVATGETTGKMDESLQKVSQYYDREVQESVKRATALIEPAAIVVMACMVLFVALSVFLPLWGMIGQISRREDADGVRKAREERTRTHADRGHRHPGGPGDPRCPPRPLDGPDPHRRPEERHPRRNGEPEKGDDWRSGSQDIRRPVQLCLSRRYGKSAVNARRPGDPGGQAGLRLQQQQGGRGRMAGSLHHAGAGQRRGLAPG